MPTTWGKKAREGAKKSLVRRSSLYNGLPIRSSTLNSDGNSNSLDNSSSSDEYEEQRRTRSSRLKNAFDDVISNSRSYVDPWDMENYSFLRRLEEVTICDETSSGPAFESTQSDFYYVPLDNDGTPQFQYHLDSSYFKNGVKSPVLFQDDSIGHVAGIEERDFNNDFLDAYPQYPSHSGSEVNNNNPSRQSERSRYNNQDYHIYTPAAIQLDVPDYFAPKPVTKKPRKSFSELNLTNTGNAEWGQINRKTKKGYRTSFCGIDDVRTIEKDLIRREHQATRRKSEINRRDSAIYSNRMNLGRSRSFHEIAPDYDVQDAYRSAPPQQDIYRAPPLQKDIYRPLPLQQDIYRALLPQQEIYHTQPPPPKEISRRQSFKEPPVPAKPLKKKRHSMQELSANKPVVKKVQRRSLFSFNSGDRSMIYGNPYTEIPQSDHSRQSSLVYVYETAKPRRKMVLPNPSPTQIYGNCNYRNMTPELEETYSMQPKFKPWMKKYAMSNYGHLKIDYSCSWNSLDRYIAHRMRV